MKHAREEGKFYSMGVDICFVAKSHLTNQYHLFDWSDGEKK
jgi:hypothetical protein